MGFPIWESDSRIVLFCFVRYNEFVDRPKHSSGPKAFLVCDVEVSTHIKLLGNGFVDCDFTEIVKEVGFE